MKKELTFLAMLGAASALSAQTVIQSSNITADTTWGDDESVVVLDGAIFVNNEATLTILPGTIVRGQPRRNGLNPGSLIVTQAGRIEALGNASSPIIFTTAAIDNNSNGIPDDDGVALVGYSTGTDLFYDADPVNSPLGLRAAGTILGNKVTSKGNLNDDNTELWGGLVILGEAPTNLGTAAPNTAAGLGYVEGLTNGANTQYGGSIANDDSGILSYISVRHAGDEIGTGNELNGITLGGVGFGTTMEYCEVYCNYDDGFEWFGGTVNANHLVSAYVGDDSFDGDQGWIGQVQFAFAVQAFNGVGVTGGDEGFEFDGDDSPNVNEDVDFNIVPLPSYAFANFTIVGPTGATGYDSNVDANGRITLRNGFIGDLYNGYVVNCKGGFLSYTATAALIDSVTVDDSTDVAVPTGTGLTTANIVLPAAAAGLIGEDQGVVGGLNPRHVTGGFPPPAGIASTISLPAPFETTTYRGAFPSSGSLELWTTGWTALNVSGVLVD